MKRKRGVFLAEGREEERCSHGWSSEYQWWVKEGLEASIGT